MSQECGACKGSGTYIGLRSEHTHLKDKQVVVCECEACGGTGIVNTDLTHAVIADLGLRIAICPEYIEPTE